MTDRSLLAHRDFRLLLLGQTTSQFGAQVSGVAVPLLAVVTLHATPLEVGLVGASSTLAFAVVGLPAGAWLDRLHRRPVLIAADWARAVLLATYVPSVVGRDRVLAGNSALETLRASGQVAGPGLGGWLVGLLGGAGVLLIQSATFAVSALSLLAIRAREPDLPAPAHRPGLWRQIREGLAFVLGHRVLRATAVAGAGSNFAFAVASAVSFLFFVRTLGLSPGLIGLVIAAASVAAMLGAALTPYLSRVVGSARVVWVSLAASAPLGFLVPLAWPGWGLVLLVAGELGQIVCSIANVSLRQQLCPDRLLGRVNATMRFLILGCFPLGAVAGGLLGEAVGLRGTLWISGGILALCPVPVFLALRGTRDVADLSAP